MYLDNKVRQLYNLQSQQMNQEEDDLIDNPSDSVGQFFNFGFFESQNIRQIPQDEDQGVLEYQAEKRNTSLSNQIQQKPCQLIKGKNKSKALKPQVQVRIDGHEEPCRSQSYKSNDNLNVSHRHSKKISGAKKGQDKLTKICLKEIEGDDTLNDEISLMVHYDDDVKVVKKKIKDKKEKLEVRLLFYFEDAALKFKYESELKSLIEAKIKIIDFEGIFQHFSRFKENLKQNLKINKILNNIDKLYVIQFIMLNVKYTIYKKYVDQNKALTIQLDIINDIKKALSMEIYHEPLKYIFLLLSNTAEHKEIQWKGVIDSLKYQLEVSRSFYKSHQCAYSNYVKINKLSVKDKKVDEIWFNMNPPGKQSAAGKGHFYKLMQRIKQSDVKNFTINHYYSMLNNNKQRADVALYLDDLFNIIIQYNKL